MVMAAGIALINAARSVSGWEMAWWVGPMCVVCCIASASTGISTTVGWVGGRDSWDGFPSISVSLGGPSGSHRVFLVLGAILLCACVSKK